MIIKNLRSNMGKVSFSGEIQSKNGERKEGFAQSTRVPYSECRCCIPLSRPMGNKTLDLRGILEDDLIKFLIASVPLSEPLQMVIIGPGIESAEIIIIVQKLLDAKFANISIAAIELFLFKDKAIFTQEDWGQLFFDAICTAEIYNQSSIYGFKITNGKIVLTLKYYQSMDFYLTTPDALNTQAIIYEDLGFNGHYYPKDISPQQLAKGCFFLYIDALLYRGKHERKYVANQAIDGSWHVIPATRHCLEEGLDQIWFVGESERQISIPIAEPTTVASSAMIPKPKQPILPSKKVAESGVEPANAISWYGSVGVLGCVAAILYMAYTGLEDYWDLNQSVNDAEQFFTSYEKTAQKAGSSSSGYFRIRN